jgi:dTDP-glucose 4,6-dehydratase/UDP-glucose 4-epimerase
MYEEYVPKHLTDPLWQRLAHSKIFITGGTGLFGHWILDSLSDANRRLNLEIEATVLTRNPEKAIVKMPGLDHRIKFIQGQVENFDLPSEKFDFIFHMATTSAQETFDGVDQSQKLTMLFNGTQRVLELAQKSIAKRLLFTSTGAVYGNQNCDLINESTLMQIDPLSATSSLAIGKSVAEYLLHQEFNKSKLEVVIARCFSFVGPGIPLNLHYALGNFIKNVTECSPILIQSDGLAMRSYMYLGDLVWWLLTLLLDGRAGEAYNVGSDEGVSVFELAQRVKKIYGSEEEVVIKGDVRYSVGVPAREIYIPCINKAKTDCSLRITSDLNLSLEKMHQFMMEKSHVSNVK